MLGFLVCILWSTNILNPNIKMAIFINLIKKQVLSFCVLSDVSACMHCSKAAIIVNPKNEYN